MDCFTSLALYHNKVKRQNIEPHARILYSFPQSVILSDRRESKNLRRKITIAK